MKKFLFAFAVVGLSIATAKTYNVSFADPVTIGHLQLKPGNYKVELNQSKARFIDEQNGKTLNVAVKVVDVAKKFENTAVETNTVNGANELQEIDLRGTKMKLEFD